MRDVFMPCRADTNTNSAQECAPRLITVDSRREHIVLEPPGRKRVEIETWATIGDCEDTHSRVQV